MCFEMSSIVGHLLVLVVLGYSRPPIVVPKNLAEQRMGSKSHRLRILRFPTQNPVNAGSMMIRMKHYCTNLTNATLQDPKTLP